MAKFRENAASEADRAQVHRAEAMFAEKLAALHAMGIVHGDLHAGNVMVVLDGTKKKSVKEVFLLDFGYSRNLEQLIKSDMADFAVLKDGRLPAESRRAVATEVARKLIAHGVILQ
jgi:predicted unusual protein kinase regulating ubiquinone biosynthesis (AarF/ABC1/UbiB family)